MLRAGLRSIVPGLRMTAPSSLTAMRKTAFSPAAFSGSRSFSDKIRVTFIETDGTKKEVSAVVGETFLEVAHNNDVELEGACGGELACSTCHCVFEPAIFATLPEISEEEEDMLDLAWGLTDTSRLGCQIKATKDMDGMTLKIPDATNNML
ncbi:Aste57867_20427 [Aphanomyces stellatus]|uniref:Aste57867_20427 protein n=1 Tax=Aphanomyces stellatus TaxID=120398 RepID=A0A485LEX7_9STRA|nr:hypothetical protein As57867_020361 [Aphanomyces stellatus]VFT97113.1 Aste57867_20427 [Aphanomyces stellatus]